MGCHRNKEKEGSPPPLFLLPRQTDCSIPLFQAQREIFFVPFFPSSFAKPFTGSTVRLSAIRCFPFLAVRRSPSCRQRKRSLDSASDDDTGNVLFSQILCMMHGIAIPHAVISSAARNLFRPLFPPPSLSRLREAPPPPFRDTVFSVSRRQTLSVLPPTKKIPRLCFR